MKFAWMSALALCGAVTFISNGAVEAAGSKAPLPAPESKEAEPSKGDADAQKFDSVKTLLEHMQTQGKELGRKPTQEQITAYFHDCLVLAKQHIADNADAADLNDLYDWLQGRAQYLANDDIFFELADGYLAKNTDLTNGSTYQWKKTVLQFSLKSDARKKGAEEELKKLDAAGAKDAASAVLVADLKVGQAFEKKDSKGAGEIVAGLKKNKVVTASKDTWVCRDYQRLVLTTAGSAALKDGQAFPCWSEVTTVLDLDGKEIKIADFKGKVVLIDFWATWCGPCIKDMPHVIKLHEELNEKGFEVLGISFDNRGGEQLLRDTIAGKGKVGEMPWRQIFDGGGWGSGFAKRYGVNSIPKTVLIDKDGKIVAQGLRGKALDDKVRELLSEK